MMLFIKSEKAIEALSAEDWKSAGGYLEDWSNDRHRVAYTCNVAVMKDRLDLRGFTIEVAEKAFEIGAAREIERVEESLKGYAEPECKQAQRRTLDVLKSMTPKSWLQAFRLALRDDRFGMHLFLQDMEDVDPAVWYVKVQKLARYGFPSRDFRCMLRIALEVFPENELVSYDLTDLVVNGCFDAEKELIAKAEELMSSEYDVHRTIIVLTEGSTDKRIIDGAMNVICPHLTPFFSFMDFRDFKVEGGASFLAKLVKAFAGSGVSNRVIAVFDNDTAGRQEIQSLKGIRLPGTIKLLSLPPIDLAKAYPTLGPGGIEKMNINEMACGIELYLGKDILTCPDGTLIPIRWEDDNSKLGPRQGALSKKRKAQDKFDEKLADRKAGLAPYREEDWKEMKQVIDVLRTAFHQEDSKRRLALEAESAS